MTRKDILETAVEITTTDRNEQYGEPEDNFRLVADFWQSYIKARCASNDGDISLGKVDVANMMILFKLARAATALDQKADTFIDIAGYAACGGEIATVQKMVQLIDIGAKNDR